MKAAKLININEHFIKWMVKQASNDFKCEANLLELEAPIKVVGDIHGQYYDMLQLLEKCGGGPPQQRFLFIGDYVDRGK